MSNEPLTIRCDVWLWAARFYKTRQLAKEALLGGKIKCNGVSVKPSKIIQKGDELIIHKSPYHYTVAVLALSEHRGPYQQAKLLYEESQESIIKREQVASQQKLERQSYTPPPTKPEKKQRRLLRDLRKFSE